MVNGIQSVLIEYGEGLYLRERYELSLSSQLPIDIYLNALLFSKIVSIELSEFNFGAVMKKESFVTIRSENFSQYFNEPQYFLRYRTLLHHKILPNFMRKK